MKKKDFSTELSGLQELRDEEKGERKKKIQRQIDDYFFKNPPKQGKKKKVRSRLEDEDEDKWY